MNLRVLLTLAVVLLSATTVFAQAQDVPFQVGYSGNLAIGDSYVNFTNTGASGGNICVNVYTFSPDEQLVACCTCTVTPNGLVSVSVKNGLINKTLTPAIPAAVVVKALATNGGACNAATPGALVPGLIGWQTTIHQGPAGPALSDNQMVPSSLSAAELTRVSSLCGFIQSNGSGYGICAGCTTGALGGAKK